MEERGVIRGYTAQVLPEALGLGAPVFVGGHLHLAHRVRFNAEVHGTVQDKAAGGPLQHGTGAGGSVGRLV